VLQIEQKTAGSGITVLELNGRLALGRESQRLEDLVKKLRSEGASRIVLDTAGVDYMDSAGLGILTTCFATLKNAGGALRVAGAAGRPRELLRFTHLDTIIPIDSNVEQAAGKLVGGAA